MTLESLCTAFSDAESSREERTNLPAYLGSLHGTETLKDSPAALKYALSITSFGN